MPRLLFVLAVLGAAMGFGSTLAYAHEATDPVCGMKVPVDDAQWKAPLGGTTYYFCMKEDLEAFLRNPEKYVRLTTLHRVNLDLDLDWTATLSPKDPTARATTTFVVRLEQDSRSVPIEAPIARLYRVDRTRPVESTFRTLHAIEDGKASACHLFFEEPGEYRVLVEGVFQGMDVRTVFAFQVGPLLPREEPPSALPPGGPLSMERQHHSMKFIGEAWQKARESLDVGSADPVAAIAEIDRVVRAAGDLPAFNLHKNPEKKDRFGALAREFLVDLQGLRATVAAGRTGQAALEARALEANSCVRCHLQFRWGVVDDLTPFGPRAVSEFRASPGREYRRLPAPRPTPLRDRPLSGDVEAGRRLYATHCLSCHGAADGDGPGAVLFPLHPRDHLDPVAMNARSDEALFTAVKEGGREVSRSRLMPAFSDRFDDLDVWDLVAYMRSLTPRLEDLVPEAGTRSAREVVLEGTTGGPRVIRYLAFARTGSEILTGAALFSLMDAAGTRAGIAVVPGRDEPMVRQFSFGEPLTGPPTTGAVSALLHELSTGTRQRRRDEGEAEAMAMKFKTAPDSVSRGQHLFAQACAACHGVLGTLAGPGVSGDTAVTGNLTDPSRHRREPRVPPEVHVRRVIKLGSGPLFLSGNMPSFGPPGQAFSEEDYQALVRFVRSLAREAGVARAGDGAR